MKLFIYPKNEIIYNLYIDILTKENIKYKVNRTKGFYVFGYEQSYNVESIEVYTTHEKLYYIHDLVAKRAKTIADLETNYKIKLNKINNLSLKGLSKNATVDVISKDMLCGLKQDFNNFLNSVCLPYPPQFDYRCKCTFPNSIKKKSQSKFKNFKRILKLIFK